ncbi:MAG: aquaporin family protein, partial [Chitinophagaceae bacterium]|nr:aquaporin family protein [Chitinophagaceae bacterium]
MTPFMAEMVGTILLITFGNGVVANVVLSKTKGNGGGLVAITFGWAMAVFIGVYAVSGVSGAHLNPAITIALAVVGKFEWALVPQYIIAQLLGAMIGSLLVWLMYREHFDSTEDSGAKLGSFATSPAIRSTLQNFITEMLATAIFMVAVLFIVKPVNTLGAVDALPVALVVLAVGLCLGGPTGYAINPARDLGPRI